jgi:hypothetical protein
MNKTTLTHIFAIFFVLFFSLTVLAEKKPAKDCLSLLQIKNEKLTIILDSIINHEMTCDYYSPGLILSIHLQVIDGTNIVQIETIGLEIFRIGDEKGYFEHRDHLFLVSGAYLDESLFVKTDKKKSITYFQPNNNDSVESDKLILDIIEDDSFSFWVFEYINGDFIFQEIHTYCE